MENLHVEIPVSVGDTLYRTNSKCEIEHGVVTEIDVDAEYYRVDSTQKGFKQEVTFSVSWRCIHETYKPSDLGIKVFPTKESLVKHIVDKL